MNEVVAWKEELEKQAKEVAALERPSLSTISLKSGVMKYQDQIVPGNKLQVVVIGSVFEHKWFKHDYDPDRIESPACFALSPIGRDMVPHENAAEPQHDNCDECPKFQWESAAKGKGKACKETRRLALLPMNSIKEGEVMGAEMALLNVPVTSGKNWANYVNLVAAQYSRPPWAVITEIAVVPDARTQFKVTFATVGLVADELLSDLMKRNELVLETLMTPYDYSGDSPAEEPQPKGKKKY